MRRGGTPSLHCQEEPCRELRNNFQHRFSNLCREDEKGEEHPPCTIRSYLVVYCAIIIQHRFSDSCREDEKKGGEHPPCTIRKYCAVIAAHVYRKTNRNIAWK